MTLPANLVYPKARLRLLDSAYRPSARLVGPNRVNLHSTGSQATSQFSYFNQPKKPGSHLHLDKAGNWEQYQYLDLQSEGDLEGNDATWSVETQGVNPVDESWSEAQVRELAEFFRWSRQFGVANKLATSSQPGPQSSGLSWHRLGIDGNFPALPDIQAGRLQRGGGMHYSESVGKVCPGYLRISQIPQIFALSQSSDITSPTEDEMPSLVKIIYDQGPSNTPLFASTAVYNETIGWVQTSEGYGSRGVFDTYSMIASALGFNVTEKHVDASGWQMAKVFKFPGTTPPWPTITVPPAEVDEEALAAALAPLLSEHTGPSLAEIVAAIKQIKYTGTSEAV